MNKNRLRIWCLEKDAEKTKGIQVTQEIFFDFFNSIYIILYQEKLTKIHLLNLKLWNLSLSTA